MLTKVEQFQNDLRIWKKMFRIFHLNSFCQQHSHSDLKECLRRNNDQILILKLSLIWLCLNLNILYPASACIAWKHLIAAAASKSGKPRVSLFLLFFCLVESVGTGLVRFSFKWHFLFSFFPFFWRKKFLLKFVADVRYRKIC